MLSRWLASVSMRMISPKLHSFVLPCGSSASAAVSRPRHQASPKRIALASKRSRATYATAFGNRCQALTAEAYQKQWRARNAWTASSNDPWGSRNGRTIKNSGVAWECAERLIMAIQPDRPASARAASADAIAPASGSRCLPRMTYSPLSPRSTQRGSRGAALTILTMSSYKIRVQPGAPVQVPDRLLLPRHSIPVARHPRFGRDNNRYAQGHVCISNLITLLQIHILSRLAFSSSSDEPWITISTLSAGTPKVATRGQLSFGNGQVARPRHNPRRPWACARLTGRPSPPSGSLFILPLRKARYEPVSSSSNHDFHHCRGHAKGRGQVPLLASSRIVRCFDQLEAMLIPDFGPETLGHPPANADP